MRAGRIPLGAGCPRTAHPWAWRSGHPFRRVRARGRQMEFDPLASRRPSMGSRERASPQSPTTDPRDRPKHATPCATRVGPTITYPSPEGAEQTMVYDETPEGIASSWFVSSEEAMGPHPGHSSDGDRTGGVAPGRRPSFAKRSRSRRLARTGGVAGLHHRQHAGNLRFRQGSRRAYAAKPEASQHVAGG